jgi:hypothetical protein
MVIPADRRIGIRIAALLAFGAGVVGAGACLNSPTNAYLYACGAGEACPTDTVCAGDDLCHPVYVPDAGAPDAGSYACADGDPQCPPGETCSADKLCVAPGQVDGGQTDGGGPSTCDLASAFPASSPSACGSDCAGLAIADFNHDG